MNKDILNKGKIIKNGEKIQEALSLSALSIQERVSLILSGVIFGVRVIKNGKDTHMWYQKTIEEVIEKLQNIPQSQYTFGEKEIIAQQLKNTIHWGSYFVSSSMSEV